MFKKCRKQKEISSKEDAMPLMELEKQISENHIKKNLIKIKYP